MKNKFLFILLTTISLPIVSNPLKHILNTTTKRSQTALESMTKTTPRKCISAYGAICIATLINEQAYYEAKKNNTSKPKALASMVKNTIKWTPFHVVNTIGIITTAPFWALKRQMDKRDS